MTRKIALLIGVNEYGEGVPSLSAPLNDVAAMQRVLQNPKLGGFNQVKQLLNPNLIEMRKAIHELFSESEAQKDDLLLLFFSGHGMTDDKGNLYLANQDTAKRNFKATAVETSFIQEQLNSCKAKRQVVILDACFSGAYANGWRAKSIDLDITQQLLGSEGSVVLTSSSSTQKSFEEKGSTLSLYTQYLVEGIETGAAAQDNDGYIVIRELHNYAQVKVQEKRSDVTPKIITLKDEGYNIRIAKALIRFDAEVVRNKPSELERLINIHFPPDELDKLLFICSNTSYEKLPGKKQDEKVNALISQLQEENYTQIFIEEIKKTKT